MAADHLGIGFLCTVHSGLDHLVGNGIGKQDKNIGASHLFIHVRGHLGKDLCLAFVVLADFLILTDHTVMSANNNNATQERTRKAA